MAKEFVFDVEYIHDINLKIMITPEEAERLSAHKITRGLDLEQLIRLIELNEPEDDYSGEIYLNIRGCLRTKV